MSISEHTRLVNKVIGLCKNTARWPSILHDLGYAVQLIEQTVSLQKSAEKITPDVVAVSNKLVHAMVIDCKSGKNIDRDQNCKYESLEPHDLIYHITVHDPNRLTHVACYADVATNHQFLEPHTTLPFLTFDLDTMKGQRNFGKKEVDEKLCRPVSLKEMLEPTGYYPFSPDDEDSSIIPHVLAGLISYLVQRGRETSSIGTDSVIAEEIFKIIHPFHEQISSQHRKNLTRKIKLMIDACKNGNSEFKQQLAKIKDGKASPNTMESLRRICEELINKYTKQKMIDNF